MSLQLVVTLVIGTVAAFGLWARMRFPDTFPQWATNTLLVVWIALLLLSVGSFLDLMGYHWVKNQSVLVYVVGAICVGILIWLWESTSPPPQQQHFERPQATHALKKISKEATEETTSVVPPPIVPATISFDPGSPRDVFKPPQSDEVLIRPLITPGTPIQRAQIRVVSASSVAPNLSFEGIHHAGLAQHWDQLHDGHPVGPVADLGEPTNCSMIVIKLGLNRCYISSALDTLEVDIPQDTPIRLKLLLMGANISSQPFTGVFEWHGGRNVELHFDEWWRTRRASVPPSESDAGGFGRPDNMPIGDLFFHIDKDVLERDQKIDRWENVAQEIRDNLALRSLKAWGRPVGPRNDESQWATPELISPDYWKRATFTYTFFDITRPFGEPDTDVPKDSDLPVYFDVRVNRAEATKVWPRARSAAHPARESTALAFVQFMQLYEGRTALEAADTVAKQVGLWIKITDARVVSIGKAGEGAIALLRCGAYGVECRFAPEWRPILTPVKPGEILRVQGRIGPDQNPQMLALLDCEVLQNLTD